MPGDRSPSDDLSSGTRVEVRTELGPHAGRWDELVAAQPLPSPFLRSWWVSSTAGATPQLVLCFADDELIGGAAFEVDDIGPGPLRVERVRMLGQGVLAPDHLDLVASPEAHLEVARAVLGWLRRPGPRVLDLDGLAAAGTLATLFAEHALDTVLAPFAHIGTDAATYLAERPGKVRSTVSRSARRFERSGASTRVAAADQADRALDALASLHDSRWSDASDFLDAWDRFAAAARHGIARGEVVIHELVDADGVVVASELDLVLGGTVAFYQSGRRTERDWRGCGSVLRAEAVRWAVASGATNYDLLRGDEPYKSDWATDARAVVRCRLGIGLLGRAAVRLAATRTAVAERRAGRDG